MAGEPMGTALAVREQGITPYSAPMQIEELISRVRLIEDVKRKVMKEGEHFGTIPGTPRPTIYQPGAQKLGMVFRLHASYEATIRDLGRGHREYETTCKIHNAAGEYEGACTASCSTMESRYRFRKAERLCPNCGVPAIIKGKAEFGGGWVCFDKKGGCRAKFSDGDPLIEKQEQGRVEHDNPADYWNTCCKMSQKRAYVGAILNTTGGSDLFTQDLEDADRPEDALVKQYDVLMEWAVEAGVLPKEKAEQNKQIARGATESQLASEVEKWSDRREKAEAEKKTSPFHDVANGKKPSKSNAVLDKIRAQNGKTTNVNQPESDYITIDDQKALKALFVEKTGGEAGWLALVKEACNVDPDNEPLTRQDAAVLREELAKLEVPTPA